MLESRRFLAQGGGHRVHGGLDLGRGADGGGPQDPSGDDAPLTAPSPERAGAWGAAVRLLAVRRRTTEELCRLLGRRGYAAEAIEPVVARLTAAGYLDDADYARSYVRIRATQRALGPGRLAQELRVKGVAEAEIAAGLTALAAEEAPAAAASRAAARKMRGLAGLPPEVARRRLAAHLARQGFAAEIVLQICRTVVPRDGDDSLDRPLDSLKP